MIYVQLEATRVRLVVDATEWPGIPEHGWMDVTGYEPMPAVDWTYDSGADIFSAPPQKLYLVITGNKGWVESDGVDPVDITVTLYNANRQVVSVNQTAKIFIRDDAGVIRDIWRVALVDGKKTFSYTSTRPGKLMVHPKDNYQVVMGSDTYDVMILIQGSGGLEIGRTF